jgi:hypothetical protein
MAQIKFRIFALPRFRDLVFPAGSISQKITLLSLIFFGVAALLFDSWRRILDNSYYSREHYGKKHFEK